MDLAAGLAQNGKIVYTYAMAPFVTLRCFEQVKVAIASMSLPVTIIGNGVGYSYNDAGPTHYATEDISCMRALGGLEILTPGDTVSTVVTAKLSSHPAGVSLHPARPRFPAAGLCRRRPAVLDRWPRRT